MHSLHTTCHFFQRKDLPYFLAGEGQSEHAAQFCEEKGIVFYFGGYPEEIKKYSERHAWATNTYDPDVHEAALYQRTENKWVFIQAFAAARNPIKTIMSSSLTRRYIRQCGQERDNYRLILSVVNDLKENPDLRAQDFTLEVSHEEFMGLKDHYLKEIKLLQLYAIQEYGALMENEKVMWISDELNGSLFSSWKEFFARVQYLAPVISSYIIESARNRATFFPREDSEFDLDFHSCGEEELRP